MSVLTSTLPKTRLNVDGLTVNKKEKLAILRDWFKTGSYSRMDAGRKLGISPVKAYTDYMRILLDEGTIRKIENTQKYTAVENQTTKQDIQDELFSQSEVMNTKLFKTWIQNNNAKEEHRFQRRFARLCLGLVNPNFKIHPDNITIENWQTVMVNLVNALLEVSKNKTRLDFHNRQALRHPIMYGLGVTISEELGKRLKIDGDKEKPKSAHLKISRERYDQCKEILKQKHKLADLCKFGFKVWTFVRPSIVYTIKTEELIFYDREIKYVLHKNGKIQKKQEVIQFAEQILLVKPELSEHFQIIQKTQRACRLEAVHEFKTDSDFNKFIYDEEIVIALEKYVKQRRFEKKKYLFWDDNNTEFEFLTYNKIVNNQVLKDNNFFKKILSEVGFSKEDFGLCFRANYGFRHFGIQMWLEETDYDYDFVQTMSHEDGTTLKQWYGKQSAEYQEKRTSEVHF